ncbi:helix-turn-helix domain-containing protein [Paenibacillus sp. FSL R5-0517]|uniref:winged helix-turn-helix transcriptional regulator n=1 Tax=unclassified Paenibacillus TaxID=185978 RepID=UPI0030D973D7
MDMISEKLCSTYNILTKRWSIHILYVLLNNPKKFKEIYQEIGGISEMMLARRLVDLQKEHLITKNLNSNKVYPKYVLTEKGRALSSFIPTLIQWGCTDFPLTGDSYSINKEERGDGTAFS